MYMWHILTSIGLVRLWNCALEASSAVAGKDNYWMTVLSTGGADEGNVFMPLLLFLLSSPSLLFCVGCECFLKSIKVIYHRSPPGWSVFGKSFPRVCLDVHGFQVAFTDVFESQLRSDSGARFPSASSLYRMSFGILPSFILQTFPSHRRRRCFNREYMLGRFALSRTSVLGTLSCQVMFKMRLRLRRWKGLSLCSCRACRTQDSLPYGSVVSTHALDTWILVLSVSFPFFQTLFVRLDMVVEALRILLLSSMSRYSVSGIVDPM